MREIASLGEIKEIEGRGQVEEIEQVRESREIGIEELNIAEVEELEEGHGILGEIADIINITNKVDIRNLKREYTE